jgi:uracil-DNA glycosylase family 4
MSTADSSHSFDLAKIHRKITRCNACPRLRKHCLKIAKEKRKAFSDETYYGKPVTGFGDPWAQLVLVGLAPAAHGANRTGRIFTGDQSGKWLYRALFKAGFSNQAESSHLRDGLKLNHVYVSCVVKCAPPDNKPSVVEQARCVSFLEDELAALPRAKVYLALGQIALNGLWPILKQKYSLTNSKPPFGHGLKSEISPGIWLFCSYHPSQQNTFTGRLTEPMFDSVFSDIKRIISG